MEDNTVGLIAVSRFELPVLFFSLQLLLQLIVDQLADFNTESSVFTMFSEQLKKTYFNILIKPDRLGKYVHTLTESLGSVLLTSR